MLQFRRSTSKWRTMRLWLGVGLFLILPGLLSAQMWNWTSEDVDAQGESTWIAVDADGNLHVSYYAITGGQLKYAFRPADSTKWFTMTLEHSLGFFVTRITVDSNSNPHICYTPRVTKYAHWDGKRWHTQEVDPGSGVVGFWCSINVGSDNKPQIAWYLEGGTYFRYAILNDGVWAAQSIEGGNGALPGKWNSMVLDAQNHPRMSYTWFPTGQLKYTAFDGKNWKISLLDSPNESPGGTRGMGSSLALDSKGNPMIVYYTEDALKMARYIDGKWNKEIVEQLPPFGPLYSWRSFRSSIVLDSKGFPHIGFQSLKGLEHMWWDGKQWKSQLLLAALGNTFYDNAMAIDKHDNLYISYRDPVDGSLKVLAGRPIPIMSATQQQKVKPTE